jgi:type I restriction enzyme R subunit
MSFTEADFENDVIKVFLDKLRYIHVQGSKINQGDDDYSEPLYREELLTSLRRINQTLPEVAINEALHKLFNLETGTLAKRNSQFMDYLQNGISVSYFDREKQAGNLVRIVDYENVDRNSFIIANQVRIKEKRLRRIDIVIFLNGLPVVVFELKSPSREETGASAAFQQLKNYMHDVPSLFAFNAFCVMSDLAITKAGTITSTEDRFMAWKTKEGNYENARYTQFNTLIEGMFQKARFLDIIKNFICFSKDKKILGAYHQYYAVHKAVDSTIRATETNGKGGVLWHTQGSGKSLSMVFFAHLIQEALKSPTIIVLTDRNDLDDQLFSQFSKCSDFLRQTPQQAESRANLKKLLAGREANGIIFTTMQKFEASLEPLSSRRNIIVMADEAHRGQYGLTEKVDADTGRRTVGTARIIRDSLPCATFLGFTGTPISEKDRSTIEVFGNYIDIYDMTQAVEDGATLPVYYENRAIHIKLDQETLKLIDDAYDLMEGKADQYAIEKSKKLLGRLDTILGADRTISSLCEDIIKHYEEYRQHELTGKAMIVAYSRSIAIKICRKILELRPNWKEKINLVMSSVNTDPEEWWEFIGNRTNDEIASKFKDDLNPLKIVIVVDMWLTGFDVPSLATMYIYKPMAGHKLMQAIARVNRVYANKEGGLVVDYVGIASALKRAMNDYTNRDKEKYGEQDITKSALPKFLEKLEVCRDLLHGFDYQPFMSDSASGETNARLISAAADFLLDVKKDKQRECFINESMLLKQAKSLCGSLLNREQDREASFFEPVRLIIIRLKCDGQQLSLSDINNRINELLKASIHSAGVVNLFSDKQISFSIFDQKFLDEISKMKERNLAIELLKKLLKEQVLVYHRTNIVKSHKFSELINNAMRSYLNGLITNEDVIAELLRIARDITRASAEGHALGLSDEELAFYDALTRPEAIKDFYQNNVLVEMTHSLAGMLRKSRTIDWQRKESARAGMRRKVKKLLKQYDYPPDGMEEAIKTVIDQCETWANN